MPDPAVILSNQILFNSLISLLLSLFTFIYLFIFLIKVNFSDLGGHFPALRSNNYLLKKNYFQLFLKFQFFNFFFYFNFWIFEFFLNFQFSKNKNKSDDIDWGKSIAWYWIASEFDYGREMGSLTACNMMDVLNGAMYLSGVVW